MNASRLMNCWRTIHNSPSIVAEHLIPLDDLALIEELEDRRDAEEARKALADGKGEKPIPWAQAKIKPGTERRSSPVTILPSARGQSAELPRPDQKRIKVRIDLWAVDPWPPGVKKWKGAPDLFGLRSANYRIIYSIEDVRLRVVVIRLRHRRNVYRGLERGTGTPAGAQP